VATIVVPFRSGGKSRLPDELRVEVALAMLCDVLEAAAAFSADVRLVTDDVAATLIAAGLGVEVVADPGGGQSAAVQAGLVAREGVCLVVNADLPGVQPSDLEALAGPPGAGALAIAAAGDGTTNALGLPFAAAFSPLYGPGSADRFRVHAAALGLAVHDLELPGLRDDVDTVADLEQAGLRA
jgi:2-phospho-L-lactate guanylyltransferase